MGRKAVLIRGTVLIDFRGNVDDDGFLLADALPSVVDAVGYLDQQGMVHADEEFVDFALRR